jgi:hypothetical protein
MIFWSTIYQVVFSGIILLLNKGGKHKMQQVSVDLHAPTWQLVRNAARGKSVLPGAAFTSIAVRNGGWFRSKDNSPFQEEIDKIADFYFFQTNENDQIARIVPTNLAFSIS